MRLMSTLIKMKSLSLIEFLIMETNRIFAGQGKFMVIKKLARRLWKVACWTINPCLFGANILSLIKINV
ncbi:TPA: hypothetical protein DCL22_00730 [Candidatus Moranbacteria bacterium]|nr:hypothetical protein [Candidatus Moranbacteria bacterium]